MKAGLVAGDFFRFEEDFIEPNIRCIPMVVRFKLDACGIKLKLAEWSRMTPDERAHLATASCETEAEAAQYKEWLHRLIVARTGSVATDIPVLPSPVWSRTGEIPYTIQEKLADTGQELSLQQWEGLTNLQRFALVKLSYPGHENKNFPRAMKEFGLA